MSEAAFNAQIAKTLAFEGGYVNDPDDPGGETNYGISKRAYPGLDIRYLSKDRAIEIYRQDYFDKPGLANLPDNINGKVFDIGVNMGTGTAVKLLQTVLQSVVPGILVDGRCGPQTVAAAISYNADRLYTDYCEAVADHYHQLANMHPVFKKYLNGWLRRAYA